MLESSNETVELETKLHIQFSFLKKKKRFYYQQKSIKMNAAAAAWTDNANQHFDDFESLSPCRLLDCWQ
jgi:hypothetical protein